MKTSVSIVLVAIAVTACGHKRRVGVDCDSATVEALRAKLDTANGANADRETDKTKAEAEAAAAAKELTGKVFSLSGCRFHMQGNDEVSFVASDVTADDGRKSITCHMKGGEDGVTQFRHAAMSMNLDTMKLDVTGTIASDNAPRFPRLAMTNCEIDAY